MEEIFKNNVPLQSEASVLAVKQYNPSTHDVFDKIKRPDKTVWKPTLDANGDEIKDDEGNVKLNPTTVTVNRVAVSMQQIIVSLRKHFMNLRGSELSTDNEQSTLLDAVIRQRKEVKYNYKIEEVATRVMSELQCAEMWWYDEDGKIKMRVLSPEKGDLLLPIFDNNGDMTAFVRQYTVEDETLTDVFTAKENATFDSKGNIVKSWTNKWGKIPIVYYSQLLPEWYNVQNIIDRFEKLVSNFGDTNDYNGSPITVVKGDVVGFASKEQAGKTVQVESDADMKYLTWDSAPEAIKLELDELKRLMYSMSHTPDISMEALKGQGLSGVAFDRVFIDAQMTAEAKLNGDFGESMQRSVNLVSAMLRSIGNYTDDYIDIETEAYRFDDLSEFVKNIVQLDGVLSDESRTKMAASRFGIKEKDEWERVKLENDILSVEQAEVK